MFIEFVFLWICVEKLAANTCRPDNTPYEEAYIPYPINHILIEFWYFAVLKRSAFVTYWIKKPLCVCICVLLHKRNELQSATA